MIGSGNGENSHMFRAKQLLKPVLSYCQLDRKGTKFSEFFFYQNAVNFIQSDALGHVCWMTTILFWLQCATDAVLPL